MRASPALPARVRRLGLLAGLLAFVIQVTAWSVMVPGMTASAGAAEVITICGADGLRTIALDADGNPLPDDGTGSAGASCGHCPLCPVMAGVGLPPVTGAALPVVWLAAGDHPAPSADPIIAGRLLSDLRARAPPAAG